MHKHVPGRGRKENEIPAPEELCRVIGSDLARNNIECDIPLGRRVWVPNRKDKRL